MKLKFWIIFLFLIGIIIETILELPADWLVILAALLWIGFIFKWKIESKYSIFISLFFLGLSILFWLANQDELSKREAIWFYVFLMIGVVQQFIRSSRLTLKGS